MNDLIPLDWAMKLLDPTKRLTLIPLLSAAAFAAFVYWRSIAADRRFTWSGFRRWLLPREIWRHRSTVVDIQLSLLMALAKPAKLLLLGLTVAVAGAAAAEGLGALLGPAPVQMGDDPAWLALLVLLLFLASDFATYLVHRLSHQVPMLWAFHRVHHSAEVLNPITLLRKHPVYDLLSRSIDLALLAPLYGIILYFWPPAVGLAVAVGVKWGMGLFALIAGNLRHSHVWLSFGPFERILVSPAQHQIHHSQAERHWDRNYGEVLAIWDWMFGTLYLPREREELRFGLAGEDQPHPNLWRSLAEPFAYAWRVRPRRRRAAPPAGLAEAPTR